MEMAGDLLDEECSYRHQVFEQHRIEIIQSVDTEKQFLLNYLRSKLILDEEDCERISIAATRTQKVAKLLDILALKGPEACDSFVAALEYEHPKLYEKLTGKKADQRLTTSNLEYNCGNGNWSAGIDGKALVDFDRQFLAKQLERAMTDLKYMTYWQSKYIEEKNTLEKKLFEAMENVQLKDRDMQDLKEEIITLASERRATENDANDGDQSMHAYLQELWKDNFERSNVIIALQGRLLVANEQTENVKNANEELKSKNEILKAEVRELTIVYDHERRNSQRLNETMLSQTTETDVLKRDVLNWKYKYITVKEERDSLQSELDSFHKWTEVLNARFDLISQEKEELKEGSEELSSQYKTLKRDIAKLETREKWLQFKVERSNIKAGLLKTTLDSLRKHRDSLNDAREIAITEKNEAVKEVVSLGKAHEDLKAKYENDISEHLKMYKELEQKHFDVLDQLNAMESKATDTQQQLMLAEQTLATMENECVNLRESIASNDSAAFERPLSPRGISKLSSDEDVAGTRTKQAFAWKRGRESLIESIRRKVSTDGLDMDNDLKACSLPANFSSSTAAKALLDYEQISLIYPHSFSAQTQAKSMSGYGTQRLKLDILAAQEIDPAITTAKSPSLTPPWLRRKSPNFRSQDEKLDKSSDDAKSPKAKAGKQLRKSRTFVVSESRESINFEPFRERCYLLSVEDAKEVKRRRSMSAPAFAVHTLQDSES